MKNKKKTMKDKKNTFIITGVVLLFTVIAAGAWIIQSNSLILLTAQINNKRLYDES